MLLVNFNGHWQSEIGVHGAASDYRIVVDGLRKLDSSTATPLIKLIPRESKSASISFLNTIHGSISLFTKTFEILSMDRVNRDSNTYTDPYICMIDG